MTKLTKEELAALADYAAANGPGWKSQLNSDWAMGRARDVLQRLRNTRGPAWLASFSLKSAKAQAAKV